jgi:hypothetical protein
VEAIDPYVELPVDRLREVVAYCVEWSRFRMPKHSGIRMEERDVTGAEIISALTSGALSTDQCVTGVWRYLARRNDVEVCFAFGIDERGNTLIIVTVIRKG